MAATVDVVKCGKCNRRVGEKSQAICCDTCNLWWHERCSGVQVDKFSSRRWDCPFCTAQLNTGRNRSTNKSSGSKRDRQSAADCFIAEKNPAATIPRPPPKTPPRAHKSPVLPAEDQLPHQYDCLSPGSRDSQQSPRHSHSPSQSRPPATPPCPEICICPKCLPQQQPPRAPPSPLQQQMQQSPTPPHPASEHGYSQAPAPLPDPDMQTQQTPQDVPPPPQHELPSLREVHTTHIPTLIHIPKAARGEFTKVQTDIDNRVARTPEATSLWVLRLMFPRVILTATWNRSQTDGYSQARLVKERLNRWKRGEYRQLWDEAVKATRSEPKKRAAQTPDLSQEELNTRRASSLAQQGQFTRALQSLCSAGLAQHNRAALNEMQAKHPPAAQPSTFQQQSDTPQMLFSTAQVVKAIKSFRKGSAPGPSGLRAEHLKATIKCHAPNRSDRAAEAISKLVNVMGGGKVPDEVAPFLCGAGLFGALKKDGGIRPIAVGNLLRRLTSKCFNAGTADRAAARLGPHQLGVGVRGGLEAIVHTVRQLVEIGGEDLAVLQLDLKNAYNMASREAAFKEVEEHFPDCLRWVLTCYNVEAELVFGDHIILSRSGFHQGDPLAGLLFSLVLQPIIDRIQAEVPSLKFNGWYLDDGTVVGTKEELRRVVDIIRELGPARGLHLSTAETVHPPARPKSTIWMFNTNSTEPDPLDRGIPRIQEAGFVLLGTPVGSPEFVEEKIRSRMEKVKLITDKLPLLQDAQTEFVLLRSCLSLPKMLYVLRTTDPTNLQELWRNYDDITREALNKILGVPVNNTQWKQAQLQVDLGGLGLRAAEDHATAAYANSLLSSQDLKEKILDLPEEACPTNIPAALLAQLSDKQGEEATKENLLGVSQKAISLKIDLRSHQLLSEHITNTGVQRDIARLASLGLPHSGDWLNVIPSPNLGLHLRSAEWITSAKYRLGCPVFPTSGKCSACPQFSDKEGDHAISCGYQGERTARHNHLRDILYHTAVSAALGPTREDRALIPGTEARPADVLIPNWTGGKDTALDVTVINPLQTTLVAQAATTPGHALTVAYNRKMTQSAEACRLEGIVFIPMAAETFGGWHESAVLQVKKLGSALARHTGQEESDKIRHLYQGLAVRLAKGNAALFLNRTPAFPAPDIDGVE